MAKQKHVFLAWLVWGLAATYYFSDYMARVAPGVMHQDLQNAFGMSEAGFGLLSYSFYIPYILMQIPVGLLIDRISIRGILSSMSLLTAVGCIVFAMSTSLWMAALARILIGFSAAFAFIAALRLATAWFPASMLGLLAGLTQALGMLGAAAGEAPVSLMSHAFGWRACMYILAGLFVILAFLLYFFIRDHESMHARHKHSATISVWTSLRIVLRHKQILINALYAGCLFGPIAVIGESFGPAYLQYGWGLTSAEAASAIGFIFIGWGFGGPFFGWLSDKLQRRQALMCVSAAFTFILTVWIVYLPLTQIFAVYSLFFILGLTNNGVSLAYATATELIDRTVLATAIAFTNMASIFVGASLQPLLGYWIDKLAGTRAYQVSSLGMSDFQQPMILLVISALLALVLSFCVRETYCRHISQD